MYSTLIERKVAGFFQDRLGPSRAGPWGLLQPLADGIKLFFKEEFMPHSADKFLYILGPSLTMLIALLTSAVIPWGPDIVINGKTYPLQVADINIGVLYIFAVVSIGVYGIMIGGWSSNNKYALLGAVRASSQMISYELAMSLSIIAVVMLSGTLSMKEIVAQQQGINWNIWYQPLGFLIFLICAFAETNRSPFDLPECETELVGGYHTEYSSMKFALFFLAEYANVIVSSSMITTLFLGGWQVPYLQNIGLPPVVTSIIQMLAFGAKVIFLILFFIWVRWTVPRFRYDQLMNLGWRVMLPLALLNLVVTSIVILLMKS
jgi:NADH-quinone oxidoreductase subunit H